MNPILRVITQQQSNMIHVLSFISKPKTPPLHTPTHIPSKLREWEEKLFPDCITWNGLECQKRLNIPYTAFRAFQSLSLSLKEIYMCMFNTYAYWGGGGESALVLCCRWCSIQVLKFISLSKYAWEWNNVAFLHLDFIAYQLLNR